MVEKLSLNPARILGIPGGTLKQKTPADITLIDPEKEWTIDVNNFYSRSRNSPFDGWKVKGKAVQVLVEGRALKLPRQKRVKPAMELFPYLKE